MVMDAFVPYDAGISERIHLSSFPPASAAKSPAGLSRQSRGAFRDRVVPVEEDCPFQAVEIGGTVRAVVQMLLERTAFPGIQILIQVLTDTPDDVPAAWPRAFHGFM